MPSTKRMPKSGLQAETLNKKKKALSKVEPEEEEEEVVVRKVKKPAPQPKVVFTKAEYDQLCKNLFGVVKVLRSITVATKEEEVEEVEEEEEEIVHKVAPKKVQKKKPTKKVSFADEEEDPQAEEEIEEPAVKRKKVSESTEQKKKVKKVQKKKESENGEEAEKKQPTLYRAFIGQIWHERGFKNLPAYLDPTIDDDKNEDDKPAAKKTPKNTFAYANGTRILSGIWELAKKTCGPTKTDLESYVACGFAWSDIIARFIEYGNAKLLWGGHGELGIYLKDVISKITNNALLVENDEDETFEKILQVCPVPKWQFPMSAESLSSDAPAALAVPKVNEPAAPVDETDVATAVPDVAESSPVKKLKVKVPSPVPTTTGSPLPASDASPMKNSPAVPPS